MKKLSFSAVFVVVVVVVVLVAHGIAGSLPRHEFALPGMHSIAMHEQNNAVEVKFLASDASAIDSDSPTGRALRSTGIILIHIKEDAESVMGSGSVVFADNKVLTVSGLVQIAQEVFYGTGEETQPITKVTGSKMSTANPNIASLDGEVPAGKISAKLYQGQPKVGQAVIVSGCVETRLVALPTYICWVRGRDMAVPALDPSMSGGGVFTPEGDLIGVIMGVPKGTLLMMARTIK